MSVFICTRWTGRLASLFFLLLGLSDALTKVASALWGQNRCGSPAFGRFWLLISSLGVGEFSPPGETLFLEFCFLFRGMEFTQRFIAGSARD